MSVKVSLDLEQEKVAEKLPSLFKQKSFLLVLTATLFTGLATSFFLLAESWYVVRHLGLDKSLPIVLLVTALPRLFFMSLGGVLADRVQRKRILFVSDIVRSLLIFLMVAFLLMQYLPFWLLLIFALIFGILDAFYWPANTSLVPTIVKKEQLTEANSIILSVQQIALLLGPMLAGLILTFGSFVAVFSTVSILLLIGASLIFFVNDPIKLRDEKKSNSVREDFIEGLQVVQQDSFIKMFIIFAVIINLFFVGPLAVTIPIFVTQTLQGSAMDLSYLETSVAFGALIGGVLTALIKVKKKRAMLSMIFFLIVGICVISLGFVQQLIPAILLFFITNVFDQAGIIYMYTLLQERVEIDKVGRLMSILMTASMGLIPVSHALVSGLFYLGVSLSTVLVFSGGIISLIFLVTLLFGRKLYLKVN